MFYNNSFPYFLKEYFIPLYNSLTYLAFAWKWGFFQSYLKIHSILCQGMYHFKAGRKKNQPGLWYYDWALRCGNRIKRRTWIGVSLRRARKFDSNRCNEKSNLGQPHNRQQIHFRMPPVQHRQPFLHQDKKFLRAFRQWSSERKQHWRNGQKLNPITLGISQNSDKISVSV